MTCVFTITAQLTPMNAQNNQRSPHLQTQSTPWCETHQHAADAHPQCVIGRLEKRVEVLEKLINTWVQHDV